MSGTLQSVPVERGQQVGPGTNLARVANPSNLKAELRIAETQTKDIRIGQYAEVDTRNGIVKGRVSRIDPSSVGGTVGVDVIMDGALPAGARPDLSVDGTIQLERLDNIIYVGRPAFGQENSTVTIFKVRRRRRGHRHEGEAGARLGEHHRSDRGAAARRPGDPVRHVTVRFVRSSATERLIKEPYEHVRAIAHPPRRRHEGVLHRRGRDACPGRHPPRDQER